MFCANCGAKISQDAVSCQQCGAKVELYANEKVVEKGKRFMNRFLENLWSGETLRVSRILAWICVLISGASLALGLLILALASLGFFVSTGVSLKDVQTELNKKNPATGLSAEIDDLRGQLAHLDDERWSQARELISGWVEQWSNDPKDKSRFIAEIKNVAKNFPAEQRSAAVDTFYRLKQEKRQEVALRQQTSWLLQLGTFNGMLVSLIVFGIFSLVLTVIKIEKNTRGD